MMNWLFNSKPEVGTVRNSQSGGQEILGLDASGNPAWFAYDSNFEKSLKSLTQKMHSQSISQSGGGKRKGNSGSASRPKKMTDDEKMLWLLYFSKRRGNQKSNVDPRELVEKPESIKDCPESIKMELPGDIQENQIIFFLPSTKGKTIMTDNPKQYYPPYLIYKGKNGHHIYMMDLKNKTVQLYYGSSFEHKANYRTRFVIDSILEEPYVYGVMTIPSDLHAKFVKSGYLIAGARAFNEESAQLAENLEYTNKLIGAPSIMSNKFLLYESLQRCQQYLSADGVCKLDYLPYSLRISRKDDDKIMKINEIQQEIFDKGNIVILKPITGAQGKGIQLAKDQLGVANILNANRGTVYLAQTFLTSAFTRWNSPFEGKKANIRPYVLVHARKGQPPEIFIYKKMSFMTSYVNYDPDKVLYTNEEGQLKINTDLALTNLSQNKMKPEVKNLHGEEYARAINQFAGEASTAMDSATYTTVMDQMKVIVRDVILSMYHELTCYNQEAEDFKGCYHLLALDSHLDENKKLWLIEANGGPGYLTILYTFTRDLKTGLKTFLKDIFQQTLGIEYGAGSGSPNWVKVSLDPNLVKKLPKHDYGQLDEVDDEENDENDQLE